MSAASALLGLTRRPMLELPCLRPVVMSVAFALLSPSRPYSAREPTPTKVAYRWVRGIAKWTAASVGPTELNDVVPSLAEDTADDNNLYAEHTGLLTNAVDPTFSPLNDQAFVDQTANTWADLWKELDMYIEPSFDVSKEQFSQLLPWAISRL